jgi:hypothetical protein
VRGFTRTHPRLPPSQTRCSHPSFRLAPHPNPENVSTLVRSARRAPSARWPRCYTCATCRCCCCSWLPSRSSCTTTTASRARRSNTRCRTASHAAPCTRRRRGRGAATPGGSARVATTRPPARLHNCMGWGRWKATPNRPTGARCSADPVSRLQPAWFVYQAAHLLRLRSGAAVGSRRTHARTHTARSVPSLAKEGVRAGVCPTPPVRCHQLPGTSTYSQ